MFQACLLAVMAGYADTIGYLRYQAFAGLMTGNTIFFGIEVASQKPWQAAFHAGIMATFLAGVVLARAVLRLGGTVWMALTATALLLILCGFIPEGPAAFLLALGMGIQNSAANRFNGVSLNTVFITGNIQKLGEGLIAWAWPSREANVPKSDGVGIFVLVWVGYAFGAGLGALANAALMYPLVLPALLLPFVKLEAKSLSTERRSQ